MTNWLQTVWDWKLPKRYYLSMCLNGLQSCRLSNFFHFSKIVLFFLCIIFSYENSATYEHFWFFQVLKLWQPVALQPLEAHGQVVPFWKPPISHCLEPGGHRVGISFFIFKTVKSFSYSLCYNDLNKWFSIPWTPSYNCKLLLFWQAKWCLFYLYHVNFEWFTVHVISIDLGG